MDRKTGIIYCRVSSYEQVSGTSLRMQEQQCREYADREGIDVMTCFVEEGESAKTANRTEFQKALSFCSDNKNRVNFFIVHKVDRFARNQVDHHAMRALLRKYGTELRSVTEPISNDPVGYAMEGMLSVFAQFDNDVRSARSKSGMVEKVKRGIWVWSPPIGYKRLEKGGNLVLDDKAAPFIRMAFEEYAKKRVSFHALACHLRDRGFRTRTGKKPTKQLIEKILRNPVYTGVMSVFGQEYRGAYEPIVDEFLFLRCQNRKRLKSGFSHASNRSKVNPDFPLRKFVVCALCGGCLTGSSSTGRKGVKYPYYHHHKQDCEMAASIPKETLEQQFAEYLDEISPKIKYENAFREVVLDTWKSNYKKFDAENHRIRKEIGSLESERQKVFDLHRIGTYTERDFIEQKARVNSLINEKKLLLEEKRIEEFNMDEALQFCFNAIRHSALTWKGLRRAPELRDRFQNQVLPGKVTFDGKKFGTTKKSLICELENQSGDEASQLVTLSGFEPEFPG